MYGSTANEIEKSRGGSEICSFQGGIVEFLTLMLICESQLLLLALPGPRQLT
jgi:hypothetical protein